MKKLPSLCAAIIPVLLFSGCYPVPNNPVPPPSPKSQLSLVYACVPSLPVLSSSVLVYDTSRLLFGTQPNGDNIAYWSGSILSGSNVKLTFKIGNASANNVLYTDNFKLVADSNYSMFFGGSAANPCHLFVQNDMGAPSPGMAKVRFVILSNDSNQFSCFKGTTKLDSGLTYQSVSPFFQVPADSFASFTFVNAANPSVQIATGTFLLGSGGICTIVLAGNYGVENFGLTYKIISLNTKVIL